MVEIAGDHLEDLETIDTEAMDEIVVLGGVAVQAEVAVVEEVEAKVAEAGAAAVAGGVDS